MSQDELSLLLADHAGRHRVPGASLAVLRDGEIAEAHFGTSDVTTGDPVTAETRFATSLPSILRPPSVGDGGVDNAAIRAPDD